MLYKYMAVNSSPRIGGVFLLQLKPSFLSSRPGADGLLASPPGCSMFPSQHDPNRHYQIFSQTCTMSSVPISKNKQKKPPKVPALPT